ncbi:MAG: hypothetical protein ABI696_08375 [Rubrivivax sp.]
MTLEAGQTTLPALRNGLAHSFPELPADNAERLVAHLVHTGYLSGDAADPMQIGPVAEREFGGGHYRDLMATFSGAALLTARHGAAEIGYLDPAVLAGQGEAIVVLLAGHPWRVREVDWRRRQVWLEPAKGGGQARWTGGGRDMSADLAVSIRNVLTEGGVGGGELSRRARSALDAMRDEMPAADAQVQTTSSGRFRLWRYCGSVANRTHMLARRSVGAHRFDGLGVDFRLDPRLSKGAAEDPASPEELAALGDGIKFLGLLPADIKSRQIKSRLLLDKKRVQGDQSV